MKDKCTAAGLKWQGSYMLWVVRENTKRKKDRRE